MTTAQAFAVGLIIACTPSLLFVACMLLRGSDAEKDAFRLPNGPI